MPTVINSTAELKQRIAELEIKRKQQRAEIVDKYHEMVESVKPKNLVRAGLQSISETPVLKQNLINAAVSLGTGWLARKLAVPKNDSIIKKTAGAAVQYAVTHLMATQGTTVGNLLSNFAGNFRRKK